jgi:hypothetical protein
MFGDFDIVIVSAFMTILVAAASYYFYGRVVYLEKKIGFLQNIVVELKQTAWNPASVGPAGAIPPEWQKLLETATIVPGPVEPNPMAGAVFESAEP